MARCPKCRHYFRTLEDEEGMHDCPRCGYDGFDYHCSVCGEPSRRPLEDDECDSCYEDKMDRRYI